MTTDNQQTDGYRPDIVIYHDKCMDGFTAAWAIWKRWGDTPGMSPAITECSLLALAGKNVLIVDFSFPRTILDYMVNEAGAASAVILDHQDGASRPEPFQISRKFTGAISPDDAGMLRDLAELDRPPILAIFDMDRSGAGLVWDLPITTLNFACHAPCSVDMVEDRDLWRFALGDGGKFLHLALSSGEMSFSDGTTRIRTSTHLWSAAKYRSISRYAGVKNCRACDSCGHRDEYGVGVGAPEPRQRCLSSSAARMARHAFLRRQLCGEQSTTYFALTGRSVPMFLRWRKKSWAAAADIVMLLASRCRAHDPGNQVYNPFVSSAMFVLSCLIGGFLVWRGL